MKRKKNEIMCNFIRLRVVSLDGTLIAPNGNMTGGFGEDMVC